MPTGNCCLEELETIKQITSLETLVDKCTA